MDLFSIFLRYFLYLVSNIFSGADEKRGEGGEDEEEEGEKAMPHDDEGLMEFYLDEMLNDEQSGAMIELVRPIGGNHAALFSRLRACYATFLYTAETEQNPTTVLLRQRQVQERKQLVQRREALERQEALKDQSKN